MTDLSAPLVRRRDRRRAPGANGGGRRFRLPVARIAFGLLAFVGIVVVGWALVVDDPDGGRPSNTTAITAARPTNPVAGANATPGPSPSIITVDAPPAEIVDIPLPADEPVALGPTAILPDLVEETEFGPIPRMSGTGLRPFDAYARPSETLATAAGKPLVAIVVSGLGLNHQSTLDAISKLPDAVTLAFAPYGKSLTETVTAARTEGHEIFLEVPLEPFDYPDNDPGPDTLLTGQPPRDNLNRLFKVMSRFGGYVGVINNMGARFTSSGADFGPMMEELAASGLGYLDDGSSNRSLAPQLATANRVPFNRVDRVLDANPSRGAIIGELDALVALAREKGGAIGMVSALPVSINTITDWAKELDGVVLVPASALMRSPDA
jgi:polysaccharide deacetylase 2 family uncharacterized protein YibQ